MATTIGRMAVVLTSDTTRFDAGFQKASGTIRQFRTQVTAGNFANLSTGMSSFARSAGTASLALTALNTGGMAKFAALGSRGGPILAAAVAMTAFAVVTSRAADKAREAREAITKQVAEMQKLHGIDSRLRVRSEGSTLSAEWEKIKASVGDTLATLGEITNVHREVLRGTTAFRKGLESVGGLLKTDAMREREESFKRQEVFLATQKRLLEERAAAEKKAAEEARRFFDDLRSRAADVTKSLRNPAEIFAETVNELNSLFKHGLLNIDTYNRGLKQAKQSLLDASDVARRFREVAAPPLVGAVDRNTMGGAQELARLRADQRAEVKAIERLEKIEQAELEVLKNGFDALKKLKPINLHQGNF